MIVSVQSTRRQDPQPIKCIRVRFWNVRQGDDHDRSDDDLSVDYHRSLFDGVHSQDGRLGQVDDGCTEQTSEDSSVGTDASVISLAVSVMTSR